MKRIACVLAVATLLIGYGIARGNDRSPYKFNEVAYLSSSVFYYETTLSGLESRAENIVKGRIANDSTIILQYLDASNPTEPIMGHNNVSLEILEVIKGDLQVGDTISILEPYYIHDGVLYAWGNYLPSIPNQEYFFFLSSPYTPTTTNPQALLYEGKYPVAHSERSRYRVPDDVEASQSYSARDLSLGTAGDNDVYMNLYQEVIHAYMD